MKKIISELSDLEKSVAFEKNSSTAIAKLNKKKHEYNMLQKENIEIVFSSDKYFEFNIYMYLLTKGLKVEGSDVLIKETLEKTIREFCAIQEHKNISFVIHQYVINGQLVDIEHLQEDVLEDVLNEKFGNDNICAYISTTSSTFREVPYINVRVYTKDFVDALNMKD